MKWTISGAKLALPDGILVALALVSEVADPLQLAPFSIELLAPLTATKNDVVALCNARVASILQGQTKQQAATANAVGAGAVIAALTGTTASV